jgi:aromatic ring-opening dioxygenase catalytic subunit (LigB family)
MSAFLYAIPNSYHDESCNTAEIPVLTAIHSFYGFPDKYYKATYPNVGSPDLADKIQVLLSDHGVMSRGVKRGLDHGVWSGFHVGEC